jgi:hypothetical protein
MAPIALFNSAAPEKVRPARVVALSLSDYVGIAQCACSAEV